MAKLEPLFKWTGGKRKMKEKYGDLFWPSKKFTTFIDAFYGGGAISHWVTDRYPDAKFVINDQNSELIQLYSTIRDDVDEFLRLCQSFEEEYLNINDKDTAERKIKRHAFYTSLKMRYINDWENMTPTEVSSHLYFMMKTSFNGWWKVYSYSRGRYATPPGVQAESRPFINTSLIRSHSQFFNDKCTILNGDFEGVKDYITSDCYVYFDPPYRDSSTIYTSEGFGDVEQIRLCEFFKYADSLGASVSLSNKEIGDGFFEEHLKGFEIHLFDVKYTAGRGKSLNNVKENFVRNFVHEQSPTDRLLIF
jgi:DNA adenine methylase